MTKKFSLLTFLFFLSFNLIAQDNFTISGFIQESESGENLIGVSIYDKETFKGTVSNHGKASPLNQLKAKE